MGGSRSQIPRGGGGGGGSKKYRGGDMGARAWSLCARPKAGLLAQYPSHKEMTGRDARAQVALANRPAG